MNFSVRSILRGAAPALAIIVAGTISAAAATFNLSWTGPSGYLLTGQFSFPDSLVGTGAITGADLDSFSIEVFHNSVSQGSFTLDPSSPPPPALWNFNFNATSFTIPIGGLSNTSTGQLWNANASVTGCGLAP